MLRKIPPLNALKAFEAAARHCSFVRAAEELNVTQAAVSQQIKQLEARLGVELFQRKPRGLILTDAGQHYLPGLTQAFEMIAASTASLEQDREYQLLTIRTSSSFASQWLVPVMTDFFQRYPHIDLRLSAQDDDPRFFSEDIDLEIRHKHRCPEGMDGILLLKEKIMPVCSPRLLHSGKPIRQPEDLLQHRLLHINYYPEDWSAWFRSAGLPDADCHRGFRYDQSVLTMQAAISGQGVALGRSPIVNNMIMNGQLVVPLEHQLLGEGGYWLYYPINRPLSDTACLFIDWVRQQSQQDHWSQS
ncbi:transcriptional regulator GcvA [Oceanospirillum sediminis]|uniref:Transcriptional regulator GcvA n=1 Tax=Oceanospirillum sediminis TaxID=2760088 RepID=A0A839INV3_9GAMM|nr:transcriptional regulator GcvA [Oceanospirillum sediminis]MBB1486147.1 transcriptional regulator GcvA [Oceanospirillum sediminis]